MLCNIVAVLLLACSAIGCTRAVASNPNCPVISAEKNLFHLEMIRSFVTLDNVVKLQFQSKDHFHDLDNHMLVSELSHRIAVIKMMANLPLIYTAIEFSDMDIMTKEERKTVGESFQSILWDIDFLLSELKSRMVDPGGNRRN